MIETHGNSEKFKGSALSISPTALPIGVFSLCSGGVPKQGTFAKLQGKSLRNVTGGIISIAAFGEKVVIQTYTGLQIFELRELILKVEDLVYDNLGNLVYDNSGLQITV